jgi:hypothetical protein
LDFLKEFTIYPPFLKFKEGKTLKKIAKKWIRLFIPYFCRYFGRSFEDLLFEHFCSRYGQDQLSQILAYLKKNNVTIQTSLQSHLSHSTSSPPLHLQAFAKDHALMPLGKVQKYLRCLIEYLPNMAGPSKIARLNAKWPDFFESKGFSFHFSQEASYIQPKALPALFSLIARIIEASSEEPTQIPQKTILFQVTWDGRPNEWANMHFGINPRAKPFRSQLNSDFILLMLWNGSSEADFSAVKPLIQAFMKKRNESLCTVNGVEYYGKWRAVPDLAALLSIEDNKSLKSKIWELIYKQELWIYGRNKEKAPTKASIAAAGRLKFFQPESGINKAPTLDLPGFFPLSHGTNVIDQTKSKQKKKTPKPKQDEPTGITISCPRDFPHPDSDLNFTETQLIKPLLEETWVSILSLIELDKRAGVDWFLSLKSVSKTFLNVINTVLKVQRWLFPVSP